MRTKKRARKLFKSMNKRMKAMRKQRDSEDDIVKLILQDHKPLKKWIKVLKNEDASVDEKCEALESFAPHLLTHAKAEQKSLYSFIKGIEEIRFEALEGDTEHRLAEQLLNETNLTEEDDMWCARAKVLAEMVEHHIEEEEYNMLPDVKKHTSVEDRSELGKKYLELKDKYGPDIEEQQARAQGIEVDADSDTDTDSVKSQKDSARDGDSIEFQGASDGGDSQGTNQKQLKSAKRRKEKTREEDESPKSY